MNLFFNLSALGCTSALRTWWQLTWAGTTLPLAELEDHTLAGQSPKLSSSLQSFLWANCLIQVTEPFALLQALAMPLLPPIQ